jgi:hypothetical protein
MAEFTQYINNLTQSELSEVLDLIYDRMDKNQTDLSDEENESKPTHTKTSASEKEEDTNMETNEAATPKDSEFIPPKKSRKHKLDDDSPNKQYFSIKTTNRYNALQITQTPAPSNTEETAEENTSNKTVPIVIRQPDKWVQISKKLHSENIQYTKARSTPEGIKVYPTTVTDFRKITAYLDKQKYEYHTYQLQQDRSLKTVMRGIPLSIQIEEIQKDLQEQGYETTKIERMKNKSGETTAATYIELERKYKSIYQITNCCNLSVSVETYKSRNTYTQCHRCQLYGHTQTGCKAKFKCLKCAGEHSTHICTKVKTIDAKCANCGGPHPANFTGCKFHPTQTKKPETTKLTNAWNQQQQQQNQEPQANATNQTQTKNPTPKTNTNKNQNQTTESTAPNTNNGPQKAHNKTDQIAQLIGKLLIQFSKTKPTLQQKMDFITTTSELIQTINEP